MGAFRYWCAERSIVGRLGFGAFSVALAQLFRPVGSAALRVMAADRFTGAALLRDYLLATDARVAAREH